MRCYIIVFRSSTSEFIKWAKSYTLFIAGEARCITISFKFVHAANWTHDCNGKFARLRNGCLPKLFSRGRDPVDILFYHHLNFLTLLIWVPWKYFPVLLAASVHKLKTDVLGKHGSNINKSIQWQPYLKHKNRSRQKKSRRPDSKNKRLYFNKQIAAVQGMYADIPDANQTCQDSGRVGYDYTAWLPDCL